MKFVNKIVKQGNSLCLRVPNIVVKELGLKENFKVIAKIEPYNKIKKEKIAEILLDTSNKIPKLEKYTESKKKFFILLMQEIGEENSPLPEIIKEKKKEFGEKLIKEFWNFYNIMKNEGTLVEEGIIMFK